MVSPPVLAVETYCLRVRTSSEQAASASLWTERQGRNDPPLPRLTLAGFASWSCLERSSRLRHIENPDHSIVACTKEATKVTRGMHISEVSVYYSETEDLRHLKCRHHQRALIRGTTSNEAFG